jgi:hypothetical protein
MKLRLSPENEVQTDTHYSESADDWRNHLPVDVGYLLEA